MKILTFYCLVCCIFLLSACGSETKKIVGVWQNESDWYSIKENNTYDTGTGPAAFFKNLNYTIDTKTKEITFYTNEVGKSFLLNYKFSHPDTLRLINKFPGSIEKVFYRAKQVPTSFN